MTTTRLYVGIKPDGTRQTFRSATTPTAESHPCYTAVIGPFRSKAGAEYMRDYGANNPLCRSVPDAERLAAPRYGRT